jgi:hypothetical protein
MQKDGNGSIDRLKIFRPLLFAPLLHVHTARTGYVTEVRSFRRQYCAEHAQRVAYLITNVSPSLLLYVKLNDVDNTIHL